MYHTFHVPIKNRLNFIFKINCQFNFVRKPDVQLQTPINSRINSIYIESLTNDICSIVDESKELSGLKNKNLEVIWINAKNHFITQIIRRIWINSKIVHKHEKRSKFEVNHAKSSQMPARYITWARDQKPIESFIDSFRNNIYIPEVYLMNWKPYLLFGRRLSEMRCLANSELFRTFCNILKHYRRLIRR